MLKLIREDIEVAIEKDPAARNFWEVVLLYPGVHALIGYRSVSYTHLTLPTKRIV